MFQTEATARARYGGKGEGGILCWGLGGVVWFFPVMMVRLVWGVGAGGEAEG